jgi:hypothetical protein
MWKAFSYRRKVRNQKISEVKMKSDKITAYYRFKETTLTLDVLANAFSLLTDDNKGVGAVYLSPDNYNVANSLATQGYPEGSPNELLWGAYIRMDKDLPDDTVAVAEID